MSSQVTDVVLQIGDYIRGQWSGKDQLDESIRMIIRITLLIQVPER